MSAYLAVVEDSDEDFAAMERALRGSGATVVRFRNGDEALAGLRPDAPPVVLVIDLNLPGFGGSDLVAAVRADPALQRLPVVVLSGSPRREDIEGAYAAGANAYVVKPLAFGPLRDTLVALWAFWSTVKSPTPGPAGEAASGYGLL